MSSESLLRSIRTAAAAGLVVAAACVSPSSEAQTRTGRIHKDPRGFEIPLPEGWTVRADAKTARVDVVAPQGGRAVIWPLFTGQRVSADMAVLRHLAGRAWPDAAWAPAPTSSGQSPVLSGESGGEVIAATIASSRSAVGTAFVLYAVQAPRARFQSVAREAVNLFSQATFAGPAESAAPRPPALDFVRWTDPREGAFTVEVPRGWQVQGGAFRAAPVDVRPAVEVSSPDGQVVVRLGDAQLPTFVEPIMGFPEGSTYAPYGTPMLSQSLRSGHVFARQYATSRLAQPCGNVEVVASGDRADAVQQVNEIYRRYLPLAQVSAGDVTFRCGNRVGYYFAGLQVIRMGGPAMWKAEYLLGYLAMPVRATEAGIVMSRLMDSFAINPQWMQMQGGVAAGTSEAVAAAGNAISKLVSDSYWTKQAGESELSRRRSNATLGVEDVTDELGNTYRVESGANHYWINPRGTIVGTNVDAVPRGDFKRLLIY